MISTYLIQFPNGKIINKERIDEVMDCIEASDGVCAVFKRHGATGVYWEYFADISKEFNPNN